MNSRSQGLMPSSVPSSLAVKNGSAPSASGLPQPVPNTGRLAAAWRLAYWRSRLAARRAVSRPSGKVACSSGLLQEPAELGVGLAGGADRGRRGLCGLGEPCRLGQWPGFAHRHHRGDLHQPGLPARAQLLVQRPRLLLLGLAVGVGCLAARPRAGVEPVQAAQPALGAPLVGAAVARVHVHGEHERPVDRLHRLQQPAERRVLRRRGDVEDLFEILLDAHEAAVGEVDRRGGERVAQLARHPYGVGEVGGGVELADHLHARDVPAIGARRIQPPVEQPHHLGPVELNGREPERLEVAAQLVAETLRPAAQPSVLVQAAPQRAGLSARARAQRLPARPRHGAGGAVGDDQVDAQPDRGVHFGVVDQRAVVGVGEPLEGARAPGPLALECARDAFAALGQEPLELHGRGLDVDLQALARVDPGESGG